VCGGVLESLQNKTVKMVENGNLRCAGEYLLRPATDTYGFAMHADAQAGPYSGRNTSYSQRDTFKQLFVYQPALVLYGLA